MNRLRISLSRSATPDLASLPRWAGVATAMMFCAEALHFLLAGRLSLLDLTQEGTWADWASLVGLVFGVPACMLWIGGYRFRCGVWPQRVSLVAGLALYAWRVQCGAWDSGAGAGAFIPFVLAPLGLCALGQLLIDVVVPQPQNDDLQSVCPKTFLLLALLLISLGIATRSALLCTAFLFPATWDYHVFRIDDAFGSVPATLTRITANAGPWLQTLTATSYSCLSGAFYVMIAVAMRQRAVSQLNVWRVLVVPFIFAWVAYSWLPVSGPQYAFFDGRFPGALPQALDVPALPVVIPPAFRNGMPSMHLTGALLIWMIAVGLRNRIAVMMSSLLVLATAWSTLASGEHYLIDLIVALPCAAFMGTVLIWPRRLAAGWRIAAPVWAAGSMFVVWLLALRAAPQWLSIHPLLVQALSAVSCAVAGAAFWGAARQPVQPVVREKLVATGPTDMTHEGVPRWVVSLFLLSGLAGLMYEVVYSKALAVTFGSTALASYTVLATYMGGMALGACIGGWAGDKLSSPLRAYAICEAMIGLYAAVTPRLFDLIQRIYVALSLDTAPDASSLTAIRVLLGVACLGLPTLLMGATFPLMFKHLRGHGVSTANAVAPLYSANVIGASVGSILAGYVLLPVLGRDGGTYVAAAMSLLVALLALDRAKHPSSVARRIPEMTDGMFMQASLGSRRIGLVALGILFVGGAVTLALEVNSMHLLAVVAGNSVYAFGLMLATFLGGLGLGSLYGKVLMRRAPRLDIVFWAQCGLALAVACTAWLWEQLPDYFATFGIYPVHLGFASREAIRALVCSVAMLPGAFFIGMSYPAAASLATDGLSQNGSARALGVASGVNTLGNILGVVLTGFWLLPVYGSRDVSMMLAITALLLGLLALLAGRLDVGRARRSAWASRLSWIPLLGAAMAISLAPARWNYDALASGSNVYFQAQQWGRVIDHAESVEGGFTLVAKNENGVSTLLTNGKFQGNDAAGGEMVAQESFGLFPLLHTSKRDSALVIGYGTGMTARVLYDRGFRRIEVAELSKDIVRLADAHFSSINHSVSERPGVNVRYTDGRNYLLTQSRRFDLISIEITSIWFAGAANLYNREFYALAKTRLVDEGVLQQWVQLHHITPIDLAYVLGSIRSEFRYVWLYVRGGQGIIVASNSTGALSDSGAHKLHVAFLDEDDERQPAQLRSHLVLSPAGVDNLVYPLGPTMPPLASTDSNLYLEHSTPKGNALGDVLAENVHLLGTFEPKPGRLATEGVIP